MCGEAATIFPRPRCAVSPSSLRRGQGEESEGTDSPQSLRDSSPQRGEPLGRGRNIFRLGEEGGGEVAVAGVGEEGYYGFLAVFGAAGKGQGGVEGGAGGDAD